MKQNPPALAVGSMSNRTTLQSWSKTDNEGRQLLLYLLKNLPTEYVEKIKENFHNEKKSKELLEG